MSKLKAMTEQRAKEIWSSAASDLIVADHSEMQSEVEIFIDRHGLDVVLSTIREICYAKANHIAVEWQDVGLAKLWLAKGIRVNQAAQGVRI